MKDIIIPVDFSETSLNAVRYAAGMLSGHPDTHIILYNMFEDEEQSDTSGEYLENLKTEMLQKGVTDNIECIKEYGEDLIDCLGRLAFQKNAELIIMGVSEKEEWEQVFTGSNSLKMADRNICPVMIIPPGSTYGGIKNVALTSDFKDVENSTPVLAIKTVLEMFRPNLHIINVDNEHYVSLTEEFLEQRGKMLELFSDFNPEFYFIGMNDFYDAVDQFTKDRNIDMVIVIPRNRSFFDRLFHPSHTRKLVFQSEVPILAAHE